MVKFHVQSHFVKNKNGINLIKLVLFGRYNIFAFLGANLLKSSDTFLISAFLGDKALAIYLIPQRLWILGITPRASANTIAFTVFSSKKYCYVHAKFILRLWYFFCKGKEIICFSLFEDNSLFTSIF